MNLPRLRESLHDRGSSAEVVDGLGEKHSTLPFRAHGRELAIIGGKDVARVNLTYSDGFDVPSGWDHKFTGTNEVWILSNDGKPDSAAGGRYAVAVSVVNVGNDLKGELCAQVVSNPDGVGWCGTPYSYTGEDAVPRALATVTTWRKKGFMCQV